MQKILIIEDDEIIINILVYLLKKEGFKVEIALNGNEGIAKIKSCLPDLIVTDIMLPYKSGFEVTAYAKKNHSGIPLIILSVLGKENQTLYKAYELGADDVIAKPFSPKELIMRIKRLLE
jgi:two-component system response regulator VicR